jgi:hypothetical protein
MGAIRKYGFNDLFDDEVYSWLDEITPWRRSWSLRGEFVDTDKFDIVPKKSYIKDLIKKKQLEIEGLEGRIRLLREEKEKLEKQE